MSRAKSKGARRTWTHAPVDCALRAPLWTNGRQPMPDPVLQTRGLKRSFTQADVTIHVLRGIDMDVAPGEIVALLGPSGSGKSTLLQAVGLLEGGFEGSIRIDGHDLRDVNLKSLRSQIGIVIQETVLFEDSIANNIAYGQGDAGRAAIIAAASRTLRRG